MSDAAQQHLALVSRALLQDKEREVAQLKQQLREKEQQHKEEMARIIEVHKEELEMKNKQHKEMVQKMSQLEGRGHITS